MNQRGVSQTIVLTKDWISAPDPWLIVRVPRICVKVPLPTQEIAPAM
jgi:hypothetical protein